MAVTIRGDRDRNRVDIADDFPSGAKCMVVFTGEGARVRLGNGIRVGSGLQVTLGSGCKLVIGERCTIGALAVFAARGARVKIGDDVCFNGAVRLLAHETAGISIGNNCLIAGETTFSASDKHSIFDLRSGARVNPAAAVVVSDHVWIGMGAQVLKGAWIGPDSVIGTRSIVTGRVPANCVAAGVPARVIRRDVTWSHELRDDLPEL